MSKTVNTGVKLDATLHERLKTLSEIKDRTPHWLMRTAIAEYVDREEVYEREKREDGEMIASCHIPSSLVAGSPGRCNKAARFP